MAITEGDNFGRGPEVARDLLHDTDASAFKVLNHHGTGVLLMYNQTWKRTFVVAECLVKGSELKLDGELDSLHSAGVAQILGFIKALKQNPRDVVESIWTNPTVRGQGYGKALYVTVHQYSKNGIESSDDLGTFSYYTWLSLYKSTPKIYIEVSGNIKTKRNEIEQRGDDLIYKHPQGDINLTAGPKPLFRFIWPK